MKKRILLLATTSVLAFGILAGCSKADTETAASTDSSIYVYDEDIDVVVDMGDDTDQGEDVEITEGDVTEGDITEEEDATGAMGQAGYVDEGDSELPLDKDAIDIAE